MGPELQVSRHGRNFARQYEPDVGAKYHETDGARIKPTSQRPSVFFADAVAISMTTCLTAGTTWSPVCARKFFMRSAAICVRGVSLSSASRSFSSSTLTLPGAFDSAISSRKLPRPSAVHGKAFPQWKQWLGAWYSRMYMLLALP